MAGFTLLTLLDDISTILDDVAMMTKVAAQKTAGVLGDDLALTAQQVSGLQAKRELPVILAVAKGSLVNKVILIPLALIISSFSPWLITPLLMVGGGYLCHEGLEKVSHWLFHRKGPLKDENSENLPQVDVLVENDLALMEKLKIKGAVRTDFVLSSEIIVIAMGSVPIEISFLLRTIILCLIGVLMTVGVYGFVAGIVKLDDLGFFLRARHQKDKFLWKVGTVLVGAAPFIMRFLTVVGVVAMFLVGGGIITHGLHFLDDLNNTLMIWSPLFSSIIGFLVGIILTIIIKGFSRILKCIFSKNK